MPGSRNRRLWPALAVAVGALLSACTPAVRPPEGAGRDAEATAPKIAYIVQGSDLAAVKAAVEEAGGEITHELAIIRAVGARLTAAQLAALEEHPAVVRIYPDRQVGVDGSSGASFS